MAKEGLMAKENVKNFLISFGLNNIEADSYIVLAENGPLLSHEVENKLSNMGLNHKNIKRVRACLMNLVSSGFLKHTENKITHLGEFPLFDARRLTDCLENKNIISFFDKKVYGDFDRVFEQRKDVNTGRGYYNSTIIHLNEQRSKNRAIDIIQTKCKKYLLISTNNCRWFDGISKLLLESLKRNGIEIKIIFSKTTDSKIKEWLNSNKIDSKEREEKIRPYCIIDGKILLLGFRNKGKGCSYHVPQKGLVKQFEENFRDLWISRRGLV